MLQGIFKLSLFITTASGSSIIVCNVVFRSWNK